jgi:hypothetical protein
MATTLQHALSHSDSKSNAINERMSLVTALDNMTATRARRMAATDSTGRVQVCMCVCVSDRTHKKKKRVYLLYA